MEETNELIELDETLVPVDEPGSFNVNIVLPTYDDVTEQKVMSSLKDVYKGFSFDVNDDFGARFADLDQVANYVMTSIDDINNRQRSAEVTSLVQKAASCARCWCMSLVIDKVLDASKYGSKAANKLAASLSLSPTYIYKIGMVARRVSLTDSYLLGMRGISPTALIGTISQIPDDAIRKGIITSFVNSIRDTSDLQAIARARRALLNAVNANKHVNTAVVATSDPAAGGTNIMVNEEYQQVMDTMRKWRKRLNKVAREDEIESFCGTLSAFSITENVPEAEQHLAEVKGEAQSTKEFLQTVVNNLNDAIRELDSLSGVEVLRDEGSDIAEGD